MCRPGWKFGNKKVIYSRNKEVSEVNWVNINMINLIDTFLLRPGNDRNLHEEGISNGKSEDFAERPESIDFLQP